MLKESENRVRIEGILSEIDLAPKTFIGKNGTETNGVGGTIKVRVNQKINGVDTELETTVHMFAGEFTNNGAVNPAYESISRIMNEYSSIAAVGIENADRIRITNGKITMNEYYTQSGAFVSFPRITASFVSKVPKNECKPEATFTTTFVVGNKGYETDKDGVETDHYKITALIPQYGGKVDVVPFYALNKGVIDAVSQYWNQGDTVKANGKLNFTSRTETKIVEVDFGEPTEQTRTVSVSELIITGGSSTPLEGDFAINNDDIQRALADRKARLDAEKDRAANRSNNSKPNASEDRFKNLGF